MVNNFTLALFLGLCPFMGVSARVSTALRMGFANIFVLLITSAGDNDLSAATETMFASIPEQRDSDGNLVLLPSTRLDGLYGEDLEFYENRVVSFFNSRLVVR